MILQTLLAAALVAAPDARLAKLLNKPVSRELRNMAVMLELGWNNIAGAGLSYSFYAHPNFAVDVGGGLGVSGKGLRFGARGRYNFFKSNFTPYIALGATLVPGGNLEFEVRDEPVSASINTTPAVQGTVGLSWQSDGGFVAMGGVGYSHNLRKLYRTVWSESAETRQTLKDLLSDGPSVSLAFGHAF